MIKGPYLSTSQFSESDVKVCEFETSKSWHVNSEIVLWALFDLHFLYLYIVKTEFQYEELAWKERTKNFQVNIGILRVQTFI